MIAAKPEKPCDGGVFGALNSLLKREQNTRIRAASGLRFAPAARICAASGHERRPQPRFTRRLQGKVAQHFARRAFHHGGQPKRGSRKPQANAFRYHLDSSKARQTVRQGRFRGLLFAPGKRANRPMPAPLSGIPALWRRLFLACLHSMLHGQAAALYAVWRIRH